jgi:hypothetical protein
MQSNPEHIVTVTDVSSETLAEMIAHLEASTEFEHLVYRESELDAVWSITGFALKYESNPIRREAIARLHEIAHVAHDLVADQRPKEAAEILKSFL